MKKLLFNSLFLLLPLLGICQEKQSDNASLLYQSVIPTDKQSLLKDVDVIFNTRFAFNNHFRDGDFLGSNFNVDQFRLEIKGKIHEKIKFRFRNRYTSEPIPGSNDNVSRAVDVAFLDFEVAPRTNFSMGKLCADWGGYEFDFNPIDILQYNDVINYSDNFLTGVGLYHKLNDKKNSFGIQLLNSRTKTFEDQYGGITIPPGITEAKLPLAFVGTWRGSFFNGKFETCYSYTFFNEATHTNINYYAFGNKFKPNKKFVLYYDFQYINEAFDRSGIVSEIVADYYPYRAQKARTIDNWVRAEYLVTPKINLLLTLMMSDCYWDGNPDPNAPAKLRTSYGFIPTIQYQPYNNMDLKFYIGYVGRVYDYTGYAQSQGNLDYNTGRLSFGIIAPILVL